MSEFTVEQIRMLAEAERMMDAGEVSWVRLGDNRVMVRPDIMDELGLTQGQTITPTIYMAILNAKIASIHAAKEMARVTAKDGPTE